MKRPRLILMFVRISAVAYVDAQIPAEAYVHVQPPPVPCVPGPVYAAAPAPVAAHAAALLFTLATTMELLHSLVLLVVVTTSLLVPD